MNVLIVENEERLASSLSKGLRAHGYTVERVSTGRAALLGIGALSCAAGVVTAAAIIAG